MRFLRTILKALAPIAVAVLGTGAEAVGAPTPPIGVSEWIIALVTSLAVYFVPNKTG